MVSRTLPSAALPGGIMPGGVMPGGVMQGGGTGQEELPRREEEGGKGQGFLSGCLAHFCAEIQDPERDLCGDRGERGLHCQLRNDRGGAAPPVRLRAWALGLSSLKPERLSRGL